MKRLLKHSVLLLLLVCGVCLTSAAAPLKASVSQTSDCTVSFAEHTFVAPVQGCCPGLLGKVRSAADSVSHVYTDCKTYVRLHVLYYDEDYLSSPGGFHDSLHFTRKRICRFCGPERTSYYVYALHEIIV